MKDLDGIALLGRVRAGWKNLGLGKGTRLGPVVDRQCVVFPKFCEAVKGTSGSSTL